VKWTGQFFLTLTFKLLGRNIPQLHFKTERVAETALRASWFWPTSALFLGSWRIFSIPGDAKLTSDGLCLQLNGHSKTFWTLTFDLMGRNIAPLNFKTERVAETALRASWFRATSARFLGTRGIYSSPGDSRLTPVGFGFYWNGHKNTFWTRTFELLGRNIAQLHFKTERVGGSALRASWVWASLARSGGTWEIFSSPRVSKLSPDCLRCQWNRHGKLFEPLLSSFWI